MLVVPCDRFGIDLSAPGDSSDQRRSSRLHPNSSATFCAMVLPPLPHSLATVSTLNMIASLHGTAEKQRARVEGPYSTRRRRHPSGVLQRPNHGNWSDCSAAAPSS